MATYTTLLKLALPTPGTESGTWGTTVNNSITSLLDSAVAGSATANVASSDWTLSDVDGGADDARCAILVPTGSNGGTARSILAPNRDKVYIVINKASGSVAIKGVTGPTTGVTITTGKTALVAWNGSDFVEITPSTISGTLPVASGGTGVTTSTGSGSVVLNTAPSLITPVLGTPTSGNFSSGTFTWPTFNQDTTGYASALKSASTTVSVSASTAPSIGQVLTATSSTTATWQSPAAPGMGTVTSVAALTLGTTGTDVSSTVANSTTTPVITLNLPTASATNRGALSSTDWSTFNGKQAALGTASASVSGILSSTDWSTFNGKYSTGGALGTPSSGTLSSCTVDGTNAVGYRNIPQSLSDKTTAYTLVTGDVGKYVGVGTSGSIVVPNSTFANGDAISIFNNTSGNITLTMSITTAYIGGTDADKATITLATRGIATILFVSSTVCVVTGNVT